MEPLLRIAGSADIADIADIAAVAGAPVRARRDRTRFLSVPGARRIALALLVAAGVAATADARAADTTPPESTVGVSLTLASDVRAIRPGEPFVVGLALRHQPGFHTYWMAPGIVGLPTSIEWTLPPGFTVGPLRWPFPERTLMYHYHCYGYERDTLLHAVVTPPRDLEPGTTATLGALAVWMACADTCHPGSAGLRLTLPVSGAADPLPDPEWSERFARAASEVPGPVALPGARATRSGNRITLRFDVPPDARPPAGNPFHFYSSDNLLDPNTAQLVAIAPRDPAPGYQVTMDLEIMPEAAHQSPARLRGLIENPAGWPGRDGDRFGTIDLPLDTAAPDSPATSSAIPSSPSHPPRPAS